MLHVQQIYIIILIFHGKEIIGKVCCGVKYFVSQVIVVSSVSWHFSVVLNDYLHDFNVN